MTVLVLVFCLQSAPSSCTEQRTIEEMPLQACVIRGEADAAGWLAEHPKWVLSRWRCEQNVPRRQPT